MKQPRILPVNRDLLSDEAVNELEQASGGERWNVFETVSNNPQVFAGLRQFRESLDVDITPMEHEVIALEMARQNGCGYCLPAHVYLCKLYGLKSEQVECLCQGQGIDHPQLIAFQQLTTALVETKGLLSDWQLESAREKGFSDRKIIAVIGVIAFYTMMNLTNRLAGTEIESVVQPHITSNVNWVTPPDR